MAPALGAAGGAAATGGAAGTSGAAGTAGTAGASGTDAGDARSCTNLQCRQVPCPGGAQTTVSGTVYDPSGTLPLHNVSVYVPNAPVAALQPGAECQRCGAVSGQPISAALTDSRGRFVLTNVPTGQAVPIVIQLGKWRRQITLPNVQACTETAITDAGLTRLPAHASEGDLPRIALTTGAGDTLECLLRKLGIAASEFTPESGTGHVHLYAGGQGTAAYAAGLNGGATLSPAQSLWSSLAALRKYDVVILGCEGAQHLETKTVEALQAMHDYLSLGGRVFLEHWQNVWLERGPAPLPTVATFNFQPDLPNYTGNIDVSFPKGQAFAEWLVQTGASSALGKLAFADARHTVDAVNTSIAQRWIYGSTPPSVQLLTANTPLSGTPAQHCGRLVFSDVHLASGDQAGPPFPTGCTTQGFGPVEKALAFALFDSMACISPDSAPPVPPAIDPP